MNITEVNVNDIKVGDRIRKDIGDLEDLIQTIEHVGLLQPIGITPDYKLVFGERRLRVYRDVLNRSTIPCRVVDVPSIVLGEIHETLIRKDFTPSELVAVVQTLRSFTHGGDRRSSCTDDDETFTLQEAARKVGWSRDTYYRALTVVEKGTPELQEAMDRGLISISAAADLAEATPDEQKICLAKPVDGEKWERRGVRKRLNRVQRKMEREAILQQSLALPIDGNRLYHCRFQQLMEAAEIQPASVQLICTDIPYGKEFLPQVAKLAQFANNVLVPGGLCVTYSGQYWLPQVLSALSETLQYRWIIASTFDGEANVVHLDDGQRVTSKWKPILIFSKGDLNRSTPWTDLSHGLSKEKDWHEWQQPLEEVEMLVRTFSRPGDLVIDPCSGGFTTAIACHRQGRHFIGCDVDQVAVVKGQQRLAQALAAETFGSGCSA